MLRLDGVNPEDVLAASGLDASALARSENVIPFAGAERLLAICAEKTGRPDFGLGAGQRVGLAALGVLGMAMQNAVDLREALSLLAIHFRWNNAGAAMSWRVEGPVATIVYRLPEPEAPGTGEFLDFTVAVSVQMMKSLCDPQWRPIEVQMARRQPLDASPYREMIGAPIRFGAAETAMSFNASWLERPRSEARPEVRDMLIGFLAPARLPQNQATADEVRRILRAKVSQGDVSVDDVATALDLHPRTLARRLAQAGTTFRALVNEIRHETAVQLLEQTSMPVQGIASHLGYADVGSFSRAFKSRAGMPPNAWRALRIR